MLTDDAQRKTDDDGHPSIVIKNVFLIFHFMANISKPLHKSLPHGARVIKSLLISIIH